MDALGDERSTPPELDHQIEQRSRSDQTSAASPPATDRLGSLRTSTGCHRAIVAWLSVRGFRVA